MMYSGSLFWNEVMPRIRTVVREPGEPLASTVTPETLPSSRCSTLVVVCFWRFSTSTVPTAPVISDRRCDVYPDRKSTRLNSSHLVISYAVFCLKKKKESQTLPVYQPRRPYDPLNRILRQQSIS